jgi:DNA-binding transcriptional LysR family regulator
MTLAQLRAFAAVARLGSVRAAAHELGVSEPAISLAVAALRRRLGDELYVRDGRGVALTAGGQRLASLAAEIVSLAEQARRSLGSDHATSRQLVVAVTSTIEEHVADALLEAFTDRMPDLQVSVEVEAPELFAQLLDHRRVDVTLGPRPALDEVADLISVPFLRYRLVVVAGLNHALAATRDIAPATLAGERWLVGPAGVEGSTPTGRYFARNRIAPDDVRVFPSDAAALSAAVAGDGVTLALAHSIVDSLRRRTITRLDVRGTPAVDLWYVTTLSERRCSPAALALRRFATTREATKAIAGPRHGVPASRVRPPVHVTLWRSVAGELDAAAS